jgi:hypothetical protein
MHHLETAMDNLEMAMSNLETAKHNSRAQLPSLFSPYLEPSYTHRSTQTIPPPLQETPSAILIRFKQYDALFDRYGPDLGSAIGVIAFWTSGLVVIGLMVVLVWNVLYLLF